MPHCTKCGAMVNEATSFCGSCGAPVSAAAAPAPSTSGPSATSAGLESNIAAALAYLWIIAVLWLVLEPYNKDRFIRFHSFQALALGVVWFVLNTVLWYIPFIWLLWPLLGLAGMLLWLVCIFQAFSKKWFKIPVIGDWAMQQAGPGQS